MAAGRGRRLSASRGNADVESASRLVCLWIFADEGTEQKDRRTPVSPKTYGTFRQAVAAGLFFRRRQPNRPSPPRAEAKRGSAAGKGTALTVFPSMPTVWENVT